MSRTAWRKTTGPSMRMSASSRARRMRSRRDGSECSATGPDPRGPVGRRQDGRACPVAEEHGRAAVLGIEVARQAVGADGEDGPRAAGLDGGGAEGEGAQKARAGGADVHRGGTL